MYSNPINSHRMNRTTRYSCLGFCDVRTVTIRPGRLEDASSEPTQTENSRILGSRRGAWRGI